MRPNPRNILVAVAGLAILSLLVSACATNSVEPTAQSVESSEAEDEHEEEEHMEGDELMEEEGEHMDEHSPDEHMEGTHEVPDEAAAVPNPIADDQSIATGAELYALNCAVCHGESGGGDGPAAAGLAMAPSDLHEGHVQGLSDGALFYIISHGKPETPMPAWENILEENDRWQVVNFLRTFQ